MLSISSLLLLMSNGGPRQILVYATGVDEHLLRGCSVSDEQIQAWADEAEAGYDLRQLPQPVRGRPPVDLGTVDRQVPARVKQAALHGGCQAENKADSADLT